MVMKSYFINQSMEQAFEVLKIKPTRDISTLFVPLINLFKNNGKFNRGYKPCNND